MFYASNFVKKKSYNKWLDLLTLQNITFLGNKNNKLNQKLFTIGHAYKNGAMFQIVKITAGLKCRSIKLWKWQIICH